jgi:hypothetical protein
MIIEDGKNKYLVTEQSFIIFLILVVTIDVKQVPSVLIS